MRSYDFLDDWNTQSLDGLRRFAEDVRRPSRADGSGHFRPHIVHVLHHWTFPTRHLSKSLFPAATWVVDVTDDPHRFDHNLLVAARGRFDVHLTAQRPLIPVYQALLPHDPLVAYSLNTNYPDDDTYEDAAADNVGRAQLERGGAGGQSGEERGGQPGGGASSGGEAGDVGRGKRGRRYSGEAQSGEQQSEEAQSEEAPNDQTSQWQRPHAAVTTIGARGFAPYLQTALGGKDGHGHRHDHNDDVVADGGAMDGGAMDGGAVGGGGGDGGGGENNTGGGFWSTGTGCCEEHHALLKTARIVFSQSRYSDVNRRSLEGAIAGAMVLALRLPHGVGLEEDVFVDGVHAVLYDNATDAEAKVCGGREREASSILYSVDAEAKVVCS